MKSFSRRGFTLIELLVVIAIIAILAVVVILTLNPAELLRQSRDSARLSDLSTIISGLEIYGVQGAAVGSSSVVYVSLPDAAATSSAGDQCQSFGLLSLPATYAYYCASPSNFHNVNGTGWIPVNFSSIPSGAPFGTLPVDPLNASSSDQYYTYVTNGSQFEVTAAMESKKYKTGGSADVITGDGGSLASRYEEGTRFGLAPLDSGDPSLIAYWTFNEGAGTIAYDYSGNNATGSWSGLSSYYTSGKIGAYAGNFDGASNYVNFGTNNLLNLTGPMSLSFWMKTSASGREIIMQRFDGVSKGYTLQLNRTTAGKFDFFTDTGGWQTNLNPAAVNDGNWHYVVLTGSDPSGMFYIDGDLAGTFTYHAPSSNSSQFYIGIVIGPQFYFSGAIDNFRLYNRALSATEVKNFYKGGK